jgi:hypothetical protein
MAICDRSSETAKAVMDVEDSEGFSKMLRDRVRTSVGVVRPATPPPPPTGASAPGRADVDVDVEGGDEPNRSPMLLLTVLPTCDTPVAFHT